MVTQPLPNVNDYKNLVYISKLEMFSPALSAESTENHSLLNCQLSIKYHYNYSFDYLPRVWAAKLYPLTAFGGWNISRWVIVGLSRTQLELQATDLLAS